MQVTFTVDLRAMDDMGRESVIYELSNQMYQICERRSVSCTIDRKVWDFHLIVHLFCHQHNRVIYLFFVFPWIISA